MPSSEVKKVVVVGAGLTGCTAARLLADRGWGVTIIERSPWVGGLCADRVDLKLGYVQRHGPHFFHTRDRSVWSWLSQFVELEPKLHLVGTKILGQTVPLPINLRSDEIIGRRLGDEEIRDLVFRPYSEKQWGQPWDSLDDVIKRRLLIRRDSYDTRYFEHPWQGIPGRTWSEGMRSMLDGMEIRLETEWLDVCSGFRGWIVIMTGHLDELCGFALGKLPWRGQRFVVRPRASWSGNYHCVTTPGHEFETLRIADTRELSAYPGHRSSICECHAVDPLVPEDRTHPVPCSSGRALWEEYASKLSPTVIPAGRCGLFKYLNMDEAVLDGRRAASEAQSRL